MISVEVEVDEILVDNNTLISALQQSTPAPFGVTYDKISEPNIGLYLLEGTRWPRYAFK